MHIRRRPLSGGSLRGSVRRRAGALVGILALVLGVVSAAPAQASTIGSYTTWNRPSTVESGGSEYIAWADKSAAGVVHVAKIDIYGNILSSWYYPGSGTYSGTGPTIAAVQGLGIVVAWTDGDGKIQVSAIIDGNFDCITNPGTEVQNDGTPAAISGDTPYLSTEGDDGTGQLYLTWVDKATLHLHITPLEPPTQSGCSSGSATFDVGLTTNLSDTSWDGPAMVVSGYDGTSGDGGERFWLMWAGMDSAHHLNVAEYQGNGTTYFDQVKKVTETGHSTNTDIGGAYMTHGSQAGDVFLSYCGTTDNTIHYQVFSDPSNISANTLSGNSCRDYQSGGYDSGGVGVGYDYSNQEILMSWADYSSQAILLSYLGG